MAESPVVNSYDEWTQLREVIVGRVDGFFGFHLDNSFNLYCWDNLKSFLKSKNFFKKTDGSFEWPVYRVNDKIISELREDLEEFVGALKSLGVVVRRPAPVVGSKEIKTPFWESIQSVPLNIRDQILILGTIILETAPHVRARYFENDYLKPLFYEYMSKGAKWVSMPKPSLSAGSLDSTFFQLVPEEKDALQDHYAHLLSGLGFEMIFDGAQCIRLGEDVLVNVANYNHELGFQWLKNMFGDTFNFHRLDKLADSHIDSIILPLRPGLWLVRDKKVLKFLPKKFRDWDIIIAPKPKRHYYSYKRINFYQSSKYLDMNILSVNENTVIVNSLYPELIDILEKKGFNVIPVRHRHGRIFGGSFHCFTIDIRRDGGLNCYI